VLLSDSFNRQGYARDRNEGQEGKRMGLAGPDKMDDSSTSGGAAQGGWEVGGVALTTLHAL
jgi:hypothetical protein